MLHSRAESHMTTTWLLFLLAAASLASAGHAASANNGTLVVTRGDERYVFQLCPRDANYTACLAKPVSEYLWGTCDDNATLSACLSQVRAIQKVAAHAIDYKVALRWLYPIIKFVWTVSIHKDGQDLARSDYFDHYYQAMARVHYLVQVVPTADILVSNATQWRK